MESGSGQTLFPVRPCGSIFSEHVSGEAQGGQATSATDGKLSLCSPAALGRTCTQNRTTSENEGNLKCIAIDRQEKTKRWSLNVLQRSGG